MKILQLITLSDLGGAQSVVANLANSLIEIGHEVIVAAGEGDGKMWSILRPEIKQIQCKHLKRALSPLNDFLTVIDFLKIYWKYKPDIVHLHSSKAGMLGRMAFPSRKVIYTVHGFDSIRLAYRKFLPIERFMQRACKAIVGVSRYDERHLKEEGITHNVSVVYNGIRKLQPLNEDPFAIIDGYKAKILCIARLSPQKNSELFMEISRCLPDYAFIWIGNQHKVVGDLPENVFFMGNLPNAGAYNQFVDLFILPSNYEGLPMVIIEAMSFGKPIVASNVGGISEIVNDGYNGYALENNASLFVDKIKFILENKSVYESFSINSKNKYTQELTADIMTERYLKLYKSTIKQ